MELASSSRLNRIIHPGLYRKAAAIAEALRRRGNGTVFAYGDNERIFVGSGPCLFRGAADRRIWPDLSDCLSKSAGEYVFGLLPFESNPLHAGGAGASWAPALLCRASILFSVEHESIRVLAGGRDAASLDAPSRTDEGARVGRAVDFDREERRAARRIFEDAYDWVGADAHKRMTVARVTRLPEAVDFPLTFGGFSPRLFERGLLWMDDEFSIAAQSPELLAHGTREHFVSHKLSGTAPVSADADEDRRLLASFMTSEKIRHEHAGGAAAAARAFSNAASVTVSPPSLYDLGSIRHLCSSILVRPFDGTSIADCLRMAMPTGASPAQEGLLKLAAIEGAARGAYYGLSGMISPDGAFSFSQVLRAVFSHARRGPFAMSGAAVTALSSPDDEYEETRVKLAAIKFAFR